MPEQPDPILKTHEVAERYNLTAGQLAQMRYRGRGPTYLKLSAKSVRYRDSDVKAWLDSTAKPAE